MGTAAKKKRAMRSRRSGVKKAKLVKSNLEILKKLFIFILVVGLLSSCIVVAPKHRKFHHHTFHHYNEKNSMWDRFRKP
jgi:hypothetical protein